MEKNRPIRSSVSIYINPLTLSSAAKYTAYEEVKKSLHGFIGYRTYSLRDTDFYVFPNQIEQILGD